MVALFLIHCSGSSPLTRGKRLHQDSWPVSGRLIPAHAGKTGGRVAGLRGVRGSSPLTRGKLTYAALKPTGLRLIPAHAGKTALE